jgi:NDP-sugar pyrophosphorylase family protein
MPQAIILAGGKGTRLRPYTTVLPKALVPLDEMPVLELVIRQLKFYGFHNITLAVGHLAELIEAYFGDGRKWGVSIRYVREESPLGTAGPLRLIPDLDPNFLVMNADIVSDINYRDLYETHLKANRVGTIATFERTTQVDFGTLTFERGSQRINGFVEKPVLQHAVSMGIYVFNKKVLESIPEAMAFGFDQLMQRLIATEQPAFAYPFKGYWLDIGRHDDYEKALADYEAMKPYLLPPAAPSLPFQAGPAGVSGPSLPMSGSSTLPPHRRS